LRFTENKKNILLVYRSMSPYASEAAVDIMLTPQFYMVKKEKLPIRTRYRAQKIAPSLFEGLLEQSSRYQFFVYQDEDEWVFIAYEPEEIAAFLQEKGLTPPKVGKVYFAEQIVKSLSQPLPLGETEVLTVLDNTVVVVPRFALGDDIDVNTSVLPRPKHSVSFDYSEQKLLNKEQTTVLAAIFILFALVWFAEGLRYSKESRLLETRAEEIYAQYPSLQSRYTRESIIGKYKQIDTLERKKRKLVEQISGMLFKGVTISAFEINQERYKVVFTVKENSVAKRLKSLLFDAGFKNITGTFPEIVVEGTL